MAHYFPLISTDQRIAAFDGQEYAEPITVTDFVEANPTIASIENDTATTYPDLVITGYASAPNITFVTEILGGTHPPHRPR